MDRTDHFYASVGAWNREKEAFPVSYTHLDVYKRQELPHGWALGSDGQESTSAPDVLANIVGKKGGGIMPLGGDREVSGGHKGYGNGMLCVLFSSCLLYTSEQSRRK